MREREKNNVSLDQLKCKYILFVFTFVHLQEEMMCGEG
jgi:hypothetical protein